MKNLRTLNACGNCKHKGEVRVDHGYTYTVDPFCNLEAEKRYDIAGFERNKKNKKIPSRWVYRLNKIARTVLVKEYSTCDLHERKIQKNLFEDTHVKYVKILL
jgi:hypothetical protein